MWGVLKICKSVSGGRGVFGTGLSLGICDGVLGHKGSSCCVEETEVDLESELLELKLRVRKAVEREILRLAEKLNFFGEGAEGRGVGDPPSDGTLDRTEA